ncbi:hypothetical protein [Bosea sp. R86505]|uniref:hypothetical protein n=1 Tax=Bosea sp. R86505 TaxID=3101710 RepID=UPI00367171F3
MFNLTSRLSTVCLARLAGAMVLGLALTGPTLAQQAAAAPAAAVHAPTAPAGANAEAKSGTIRSVLADLALGYQLYGIGQERKDPLVVIAAARLIASVPLADRQREKVERGGTDSAGADKKPLDLAAVLTGARTLAAGDKTLLAMIADVEATASRGRVGGVGRTSTRVRAGATDVFTERFRGRESAEVSVSGDGDTDLDLYVYDENGNLICKDDDYTDQLFCRWNPRWTGFFRVEVVNRGSVYNAYTLVTN